MSLYGWVKDHMTIVTVTICIFIAVVGYETDAVLKQALLFLLSLSLEHCSSLCSFPCNFFIIIIIIFKKNIFLIFFFNFSYNVLVYCLLFW